MFSCSKCGQCCKNIGKAGALLPSGFDKGNGVCRHLTKDNLCAIYDHRPEVCDVDLFYQNHLTSIMSKEEWYKKNAAVCATLKNKNKQ